MHKGLPLEPLIDTLLPSLLCVNSAVGRKGRNTHAGLLQLGPSELDCCYYKRKGWGRWLNILSAPSRVQTAPLMEVERTAVQEDGSGIPLPVVTRLNH